MDMNHLIGQRFNLISKSDIRYVGTLHEINPEASTIALENVVSFGTEGRRGNPAEEIPPSASVYEYIVFRGSDVKDISVAEDKKEDAAPEPPQVPDDPAILGDPSLRDLPNPNHRHNNPRYHVRPRLGILRHSSKEVSTPPMDNVLEDRASLLDLDPDPDRASPICRPLNMPKAELPVGDRPSSKPGSRHGTPGPAGAAQNAPTPPIESKPPVAEALQASTGPTQGVTAAGTAKAPPTGPKSGRVQPAIPISAPSKPPIPVVPGAAGVPQAPAQAAITEATRAATAAVAAAMAKLPQPGAQKKPGDISVEAVTKQMADLKPYEHRAPRGGHPRGGRGGAHRGQHQGKKIEVPETDYDFETANAKFNKQDLLKEAIATGSPAHEVEPHIPNGEPETPDASYPTYNKSSSFFDNISSEARDREEGSAVRGGGREWRGEEEKRNIETFGQGSVDGYRGSYRGRGRGRGYGRGRGGGGYGRGYHGRGRGGMRGGRNVSQSTGVPAQN
ncbi:hypothetical protein BBP40_002624 [Aspergillus hancockii]|nr:hypothetical protein BBP40_002624 [Aspergillus hancockii]